MKILVLNPNTSDLVTKRIADQVRRIARPDTQVDIAQLPHGPETLESYHDESLATPHILDAVKDANRQGYDAVVLWHAYPRIGFDDRNQFDFYRDMPGGLEGLRHLSREFRSRGVRVFIDYNPWDTGTRREGVPDIEALARTIEAIYSSCCCGPVARPGSRTRLTRAAGSL